MKYLQMPIVQILASAFFGFCISFMFFFLGKKKKKLQYNIASVPLITDAMPDIPGITITMNGQPINDLVSTEITFHNTGNQNIESADFAQAAPLTIVTDGKFFDPEGSLAVISRGGQASSFSITRQSQQAILLNFDYVKPKQVFSISVLHSGSISVCGTLKAGKITKSITNTKSNRITSAIVTVWRIVSTFGMATSALLILLNFFGVLSLPGIMIQLSGQDAFFVLFLFSLSNWILFS